MEKILEKLKNKSNKKLENLVKEKRQEKKTKLSQKLFSF